MMIGQLNKMNCWYMKCIYISHGNTKRDHRQRGHAWDMIRDSLNDIVCPKFSVTQKSVRDHYTLLQKQKKGRLREKEKASGISP